MGASISIRTQLAKIDRS